MFKISYYRFLLLVSTVISAVFFSSCEYEPSGTYLVNLEKPTEVPPVEFELNLMTDTISFYWASKINLKINAGDIKITDVRFFLDGQLMGVTYTGSKYYSILNFSQPGVHKFRVEVSTGSGSHSIAEGLGIEGFQFDSREWTLVAKDIPPGNLKYVLDNTGLTFFWEKYDGPEFKGYRLREIETGQFFLQGSTTFKYSTYVGQTGCYDLYIIDDEGNDQLWGRCFLDRSLPLLRISEIDRKVAIVWNSTIFKNNIAEYQLFQRDWTDDWKKVGTFSVNDTVFIVPDIANLTGRPQSFYLYSVPKSNLHLQNTNPFCSIIQYVDLTLPGPKFSGHYGATCSGFYFEGYSSDFQKSLLFKYSIASNSINFIKEFSSSGINNLSPNCNYFLSVSDSILELFDLNTNNSIKSFNILSVAPNLQWSVTPIVSDNGICIFTIENTLYVYDILNDRLVTKQSRISGDMKISPDGQLISVLRSDSMLIYHINENSISNLSGIKITYSPVYFHYYDFCANQSDYLYTFEPPLLNVRSCNDLSVVRSLDIGDWFYNIDFCNNKVLSARGGGMLDVYDFLTGELLHSVRFGMPGGSGSHYYTLLADNTIYFSEHKYYLPEKK